MSERLTRADVERIAALARLRLDPGEVDLFAGQLSDILAFARRVQAIDTSGVEPFVAAPSQAQLRDDEPRAALPREQVLHEAPAAADGFFKVPRVLGS